MKKIMDLYGHFAEFEDFYRLENSWLGRIILNEDNTFEGCAEAYDDEDTSLLLFGDIEGDTINTYVIGKDYKYPRCYRCEKEDSKYYGFCSVTDGFVDLTVGEAKMTLIDAEKNREITDFEVNSIKKGIKIMKRTLDDMQRESYENIVNNNYINSIKTK